MTEILSPVQIVFIEGWEAQKAGTARDVPENVEDKETWRAGWDASLADSNE